MDISGDIRLVLKVKYLNNTVIEASLTNNREEVFNDQYISHDKASVLHTRFQKPKVTNISAIPWRE